MLWLEKHNPIIDWRRRTLIFSCPSDPSINTLSHKSSPIGIESLCGEENDTVDSQTQNKSKQADLRLWHLRLGHRNCQDITVMHRKNLATSLDFDNNQAHQQTREACLLGKSKRKPLPKACKRPIRELCERVSFDTCGPMSIATHNGERYFITFSDHKSRFTATYLMQHKSEAFEKFKKFKCMIEKVSSRKIKTVFSDNATEYLTDEFQQFLSESNICFQSTVPYCSKQNGIAERGHYRIMDSVRSMLIHARLPKVFWGFAVLTATHIHNLLPHPELNNTTPHEVLKGQRPDVSYLRV